MKGAGGADYGKTCNARFWPEPHELTCQRRPGHDGEHSSEATVRGSFSATDRFEILRWAGARPGVLALLAALREHNYDEMGTEYLRRIVDRDVAVRVTGADGSGGKCANCGLDIAVGKHTARGSGMCEIPVTDSELRDP